MANRPLVLFAICWVLGSTAAAAGFGGWSFSGAAAAAALLLLALARYGRVPLRLALCCALAFPAAGAERLLAEGGQSSELLQLLKQENVQSAPVLVRGGIASRIMIDGDRVRFDIDTNTVDLPERAEELKERILVQLKLEKQEDKETAGRWRRGQLIELKGTLEEPEPASNFGGFDYRGYLQRQHIHLILKVNGIREAKAEDREGIRIDRMLGIVDQARSWLGDRLEGIYSGEHSGYMKGLMIGLRDDLDPDRYRQFSQLGLTHILAISGLHIAVFLFMVQQLLKAMRLSREQTLIGMMLVIPVYMLLSGGSPSVVRAGIMAMLGLLAARMGKLKDGLHVLAAAAVMMLAYDPFLIHDIGFQLSFLVTGGLIVIVPPFRSLLPQHKRWNRFWDAAAVTVVAQIVSLPVTLFYFNQFHLLSLIANLVLVPFISAVVIPLGGVSLLLSVLYPPIGAIAAGIVEFCNQGCFIITDWLNRFDGLYFIFATPPLWWLLLYYVLLALCVWQWRKNKSKDAAVSAAAKRNEEENGPAGSGAAADTMPLDTRPLDTREGAAQASNVFAAAFLQQPAGKSAKSRKHLVFGSLFLLFLPLLLAYHVPRFSDQAVISFLDVGQGDAILVRTPGGRHILIDGGGQVMFRKPGEEWRQRRDPFEVGRKVVVPLLQKRGVQAIDLLVISHLDSDHIKGLLAVIDTIPVKHVLWNGTYKQSGDAGQLLAAAANRGIPMYKAQSGMRWQLDRDALLTVIGGADDRLFGDRPIMEAADQNEHSVALVVQLYGRRFLFAGDAETGAERRLIQQAGQLEQAGLLHPAGVDVMKLSHHGSKTSTTAEWLEFWQPRLAAISVGRTNFYGHPSQEVIERVSALRIPIYRTDRDGEIQFKVTKDNRFYVRGMRIPA